MSVWPRNATFVLERARVRRPFLPLPSIALQVRNRTGTRRQARLSEGSIPGDEVLRTAHFQAMADLGDDFDVQAFETILKLKLGRQKGVNLPQQQAMRRTSVDFPDAHRVGMVIQAGDPLPPLPSDLAEVALCGRSNAGKSALLNALTGHQPHKGVASVSARPGWTTSIQFFEIRRPGSKPHEDGVMTIVDLPGYGPAAASEAVRQQWARATRRYLRNRKQLICAFVLVDATLGLTPDDRDFLDLLDTCVGKGGERIEYHGVLTKCDLLEPHELAQSYTLIAREMEARSGYAGGDLPMSSARNHTGVGELWQRLHGGVEQRQLQLEEDEEGDDDDEEEDEGEDKEDVLSERQRAMRKYGVESAAPGIRRRSRRRVGRARVRRTSRDRTPHETLTHSSSTV